MINASVKKSKGYFGIDIDGKDISPVANRSFRPSEKVTGDFAKYGFQLFTVFPTGKLSILSEKIGQPVPYSEFGEVWVGEGEYNWDNLKKQVDIFNKNAPDGYVSLMVQLDTRDWYLKMHPECCDSFQQLVQVAGYKPWRESAARFMCDLIDKMDELMPGRVYQIHIAAGGTTEWYTRKADEALQNPLAIQLMSYREYCSDVTAAIPSYEALNHTTEGVLSYARIWFRSKQSISG